MDNVLWEKILKFDFDNPFSEYGFSIRLANENFWTKEFTELAILEYKKFMYLAATAESMVSPSEIVDIVWHQHLIFTQSYQEFCKLISKQIQHVPSTHNKDEFEKFKQAKERTNTFYTNIFGEQPKAIWEYASIFDSLNLEKAKYKIRTFLIFGILSFIVLTIPFYFLLKPIYMEINNPYFGYSFISICILTVLIIEIYNHNKLKEISKTFDIKSFIFQLQPFELVYLKTQKIENVINGTVNELIENNSITINNDNSINLSNNIQINTQEQQQTVTVLNEFNKIFYPTLIKHLANKPLFWNTSNSLDAFRKFFKKSRKFGNLFYINFGILTLLLMFGFIRLTTGILRDKPIAEILLINIFLAIFIIFYLNRLTKLICTQTIPNLYKNEILTKQQIDNNWQWNYFLYGTAVLSTAFVPIANYVEKNNSISSSCGSSCGNSCGSSCGSSCGGCGGD